MKNYLRVINERYKDLNVFSYEGFLFILSIFFIPQIIGWFIPINLQVIGIFFIILGMALMVDNYFRIKNIEKEVKKK